MHIGSTRKRRICCDLNIDGCKEIYVTSVETGLTQIKDTYQGEEVLETFLGKKYLGDTISKDGKNYKNIAIRKNKGVGLVREINALLVEMKARNEHF